MPHIDHISLLPLHSFENSEGTKIAPGRMINLAAGGQINLTAGQGLCQPGANKSPESLPDQNKKAAFHNIT